MSKFISADSSIDSDPQLLKLYQKSFGENSNIAPYNQVQLSKTDQHSSNWETYFQNIISNIHKLETLTNQITNIPENLGTEISAADFHRILISQGIVLPANRQQLRQLYFDIYINFNEHPAIISQSEEYSEMKNSLSKFQSIIKSINENIEGLQQNFEFINGRKFQKEIVELRKFNEIIKNIKNITFFPNSYSRWSIFSFPFSQSKSVNTNANNLNRAKKLVTNLSEIISLLVNCDKNIQELIKHVQSLRGGNFPMKLIENRSILSKNYWLFQKQTTMPSFYR